MNKNPTPDAIKSDLSVKSSLFGLISREKTPKGTIRVKLNLKVLAVLLLVLFISAWMTKTVALYYFFKEVRNFEDVTLTDTILFPLNRSALRKAQGDYQIQEGVQAFEAGEYRQAILLLRQGVNRSPENAVGRLALAKVYTGWKNDVAIGLLEEGYSKGIRDLESTRLFLDLLFQEKEDAKVLRISEEIINKNENPDLVKFAQIKKIQSAIATGQLELADAVFRESDIKMTLNGLILGSDLLVKLGKDDDAINILQFVIRKFPDANLDPVFSVLFEIIRKNEKWEMGRDYALKNALRNALAWEPRLTLIEFLEKSGETARRDQEISALIKSHQSNERAMLLLAAKCAELGLASTNSNIYRIALQNHFDLSAFSLLLIESYSNSQTPQVSIQLIDQIIEENPQWIGKVESQFNAIRSLAYYRAGDTDLGKLYFTYFIESRSTSLQQIASVIHGFVQLGMVENSLKLYEEAYLRDPDNESVLSDLINYQLKSGNSDQLSARLKNLITLRRPNYDTLRSIAKNLKGDRFIFTADRGNLMKKLDEIINEPASAEVLLWKDI